MNADILTAILGTGGIAAIVPAIFKMVASLRAGSDKRNLSAISVAEKQRDDARTQTDLARDASQLAEQTAKEALQTLGRTRTFCASHHGTPWDDLPKLPGEN